MIVPDNLDSWNLKIIAELTRAGMSESDRHDFKAGLPDPKTVTKICCAFANTFGGFFVLGVAEAAGHASFEIVGVDLHTEWYARFVSKIKADPDISILGPKIIEISGHDRGIYVFHIPQSPRRPHLPTRPDERIFWKRQGSDCAQMTLEEVRLQMVNTEERREKLALLLIDLFHKRRSLTEQASMGEGQYNGAVFSFEVMDRVVTEAFTFLRQDVNSIGVLDTLRKTLEMLNAQKEILLRVMSMSYAEQDKKSTATQYRELCRNALPHVTVIVDQVERSFKEKFGIENPYESGTVG